MLAFLRVEKGRIQDYEESSVIPLGTDVLVIGRPFIKDKFADEIPHVKVMDDYVSHEHASILYSYGDGYFLLRERTTGSTNGTFINGKRIDPGMSYGLRDGYLIGLAQVAGNYRIVLRFRESEDTLPGLLNYEDISGKGININFEARRLWINGEEIPLCRKQFDLLAFLYQNAGKACSKHLIAEKVWAEENGIVTQETIEQTIHRIRSAIEPDRANPRFIKTIHGGYRLDL